MNWIQELIEYLSNSVKFWAIVQPWESGLRIRAGNHIKQLNSGIHLKLPVIDFIYIRSTRTRIITFSPQTLTTKDDRVLTIMVSMGYSISSVQKLYESLCHPEKTIENIIKNEVSNYVSGKDLSECDRNELTNQVLQSVQDNNYGIKFERINVVGFAAVKTFRIIKDDHWEPETADMDETK